MSTNSASGSTSGGGESTQNTGFVDTSCYTHQIPHSQYSFVCACLNTNVPWKELAREMQFRESDLVRYAQKLKDNPADVLLSLWGDQNHTVTELFMLLNSLRQYTAMFQIKDLVDKRFHRLISKGQPDIQLLLASSAGAVTNKSLNSKPNTQDTDMESSDELIIDSNRLSAIANQIPQIRYDELVAATNNWNRSKVLGRGGFGTVFKGLWKYTDVAIKRIEYHKASLDSKRKAMIEMKQSLNELRYLNSCRHDNILPLYGFSMDGSEPCLVYQLMAGGALEARLQYARQNIHKALTFEERKRILLGTARGLQYLHTFNAKPLIHGDIKPANILLDPCCVPKIGDFGLVREGSTESVEISLVCGTRPYLPLDYIQGHRLSTKIDTFSYGVVLLELLTGLRAYDKDRTEPFLVNHIYGTCRDSSTKRSVIDKAIEADDILDTYLLLFNVAIICITQDSSIRPEMITVFNELEKIIK